MEQRDAAMGGRGRSSAAPPPASCPTSLSGAAGVVVPLRAASCPPPHTSTQIQWLRPELGAPPRHGGPDRCSLVHGWIDLAPYSCIARPSQSTDVQRCRGLAIKPGSTSPRRPLVRRRCGRRLEEAGGLCVKSSACRRLADARCTCP
jgi:hypothetical protein